MIRLVTGQPSKHDAILRSGNRFYSSVGGESALRPTKPSVQLLSWALSPGVKRPGRDANCLSHTWPSWVSRDGLAFRSLSFRIAGREKFRTVDCGMPLADSHSACKAGWIYGSLETKRWNSVDKIMRFRDYFEIGQNRVSTREILPYSTVRVLDESRL